MFSLCGLSEAHCFETICPDVLKTRSEAALDALIIRYFLIFFISGISRICDRA